MISEIRRYGMVPIFGALHGSGDHLIGREVTPSATSRSTGIGSTGLLLLLLLNWTLAVLIEQNVTWQWNDILRLVLPLLLLLLLLLLQLSIGLLLLLLMLLLEGGSHLSYLVALV